MRRAVTAMLTATAAILVARPALASDSTTTDTLAGPGSDTAVASSDNGLFLPAGVLIALGVAAIVLGVVAVVWSRRRTAGTTAGD